MAAIETFWGRMWTLSFELIEVFFAVVVALVLVKWVVLPLMRGRGGPAGAEEEKTLNELMTQARKLEERIGNLETILAEKRGGAPAKDQDARSDPE